MESHVLRLTSDVHRIRFVPIHGPIPLSGSFVLGPVLCKLGEGLSPLSFGRSPAPPGDLTGITLGAMLNLHNTNTEDNFRRAVSHHHADLCVFPGPRFFIRDTRSKGGTFLNAVRLSGAHESSSLYELKNGDTLQFGSTDRPTMMKVEIGPHLQSQNRTDIFG